MVLYTGKGDKGDTYVFDTPKGKRISKTSVLVEALGALDELNSICGVCKIKAQTSGIYIGAEMPSLEHILHEMQENLFIVQAELAGAPKCLAGEKVRDLERITTAIEAELPPITTFFVPGGTELSAFLDVARTTARRIERRIVAVREAALREVGDETLAYLNRLSSALYACARYANYAVGVEEDAPEYE